jgi:hypothetical protein
MRLINTMRYSIGDAVTRMRWHSFSKNPHRRYDGMLVQVSDGAGVGIARIKWAPEFTSFQIIDSGRLMYQPRWWKLLSAPP